MSNEISKNLKEQISLLENVPGVYQFYDISESLLYVGKAKKLKNRVSSYFNKIKFENRKTQVMVQKVESLKTIQLNSEIDALLLENSLIKKYQPRYNIQLKDDKTYPWICIKNEFFPRVFYTRKKIKDGSLYFGPYPSVKVVKAVLELVKDSFEIRTCDHQLSPQKIEDKVFKTSVDFYIGNCKGCCQGEVDVEIYQERLNNMKQVLYGNTYKALKALREEMKDHARVYQYEEAEKLKIKIKNIEKFQAKSVVVDSNISSLGVINIVSHDNYAFVNTLKVMNGAITKSKTTVVKKKLEESEDQIISYVIADNLNDFFDHVKEIISPYLIALETAINFHIPQRGDKKALLLLSKKNALAKKIEFLKTEAIKNPETPTVKLLEIFKKDLRLNQRPVHMECFDNSNIQGNFPVAACVVFKNGKPSKKDYRLFNIKTVEGPDDFASMEEVIFRRYQRLIQEEKSLPQLIVVDGGKGQLSSALKSLEKLKLAKKIAIIGIAKRLEEIYFPGDQYPLYLDKKTPTLKVIQNMRNEAHRFGITHHRNRRMKGLVRTELTSIEGIGEKTITMLLSKYKSVNNLKTISLTELEDLLGKSKANKIFNGLKTK
ncbi:MAG: excinuclease ABC subunit UvrC [Parvicellaceae bacterium]|nr:MAG: UvrABC system protein C [Crocinitomicaceae bacterium]|tara:strand:- start:38584 stop:40389 length:1806 start_codon:yes stop_codon:yes gene_type:complete